MTSWTVFNIEIHSMDVNKYFVASIVLWWNILWVFKVQWVGDTCKVAVKVKEGQSGQIERLPPLNAAHQKNIIPGFVDQTAL